jgi:hypothetical protein
MVKYRLGAFSAARNSLLLPAMTEPAKQITAPRSPSPRLALLDFGDLLLTDRNGHSQVTRQVTFSGSTAVPR